MIDQILNWQDDLIPGPALDIGAGDGEISLWLASHGFAVDALEPDLNAAKALRPQISSLAIHLHTLNVLGFPLPTNHYTVIVASAVLHFIDHAMLPALAQGLIKSLVPGGMLFAAVFTCDDPAREEPQKDSPTPVRHFFERDELRQLFMPLDVLVYEESRRAAPQSSFGYRSGATLVARLPAWHPTPPGL
jgi:tellurite methyltransferase